MDKIKFYLPEMTREEAKKAAEEGASLLIPIATIEQSQARISGYEQG